MLRCDKSPESLSHVPEELICLPSNFTPQQNKAMTGSPAVDKKSKQK
jgi:hypothetical protein